MRTRSTTGSAIARCREMAALIASCAAVALTGCGDQAEASLDKYLKDIEFNTPLESSSEVELGPYRVAVAARRQDPSQRRMPPTWMRVKFRLIVVVAPEDDKSVVNASELHRGMLDDTVLSVLRHASLDELEEAQLSTLKSRVIDAIRPILGGDRVRGVVLNDFVHEPI